MLAEVPRPVRACGILACWGETGALGCRQPVYQNTLQQAKERVRYAGQGEDLGPMEAGIPLAS